MSECRFTIGVIPNRGDLIFWGPHRAPFLRLMGRKAVL